MQPKSGRHARMRPHRVLRGAIAGLSIALGLYCVPVAAAERVTLFAAASLRTVLEQLAPAIEAETGSRLVMSFAASSALARQIEHGAPADIYISANAAWMDHLESQGLIAAGTRVDIAGNRLVLVTASEGPVPQMSSGSTTAKATVLTSDQLERAKTDRGVAVAFVDAVPAGIYARAALTSLGAWEDWAPHLVQTDNVRTALALVALGELPYGIVYASDAAAEPRVRIVGVFPDGSHPFIVYPAAAVAARDRPGTRAVLDSLTDPDHRTALTELGFDPAPAAGAP